jgi:hypothetical protein
MVQVEPERRVEFEEGGEESEGEHGRTKNLFHYPDGMQPYLDQRPRGDGNLLGSDLYKLLEDVAHAAHGG